MVHLYSAFNQGALHRLCITFTRAVPDHKSHGSDRVTDFEPRITDFSDQQKKKSAKNNNLQNKTKISKKEERQ